MEIKLQLTNRKPHGINVCLDKIPYWASQSLASGETKELRLSLEQVQRLIKNLENLEKLGLNVELDISTDRKVKKELQKLGSPLFKFEKKELVWDFKKTTIILTVASVISGLIAFIANSVTIESWYRQKNLNVEKAEKSVQVSKNTITPSNSKNEKPITTRKSIIQTSKGHNSPNINGNNNQVIINDSSGKATTEKPELALKFVSPDFPALVVVNKTDVIARDIKWGLVLWNMDLPDRDDPLPIPLSSFDWLRPNSESGRLGLFNNSSVGSLLKEGDRLFGSAFVICAECSRGRTYVVYVVWGKNGWVTELENVKSGELITPKNALKEGRYKYFAELEAQIPINKRTAIQEQ